MKGLICNYRTYKFLDIMNFNFDNTKELIIQKKKKKKKKKNIKN